MSIDRHSTGNGTGQDTAKTPPDSERGTGEWVEGASVSENTASRAEDEQAVKDLVAKTQASDLPPSAASAEQTAVPKGQSDGNVSQSELPTRSEAMSTDNKQSGKETIDRASKASGEVNGSRPAAKNGDRQRAGAKPTVDISEPVRGQQRERANDKQPAGDEGQAQALEQDKRIEEVPTVPFANPMAQQQEQADTLDHSSAEASEEKRARLSEEPEQEEEDSATDKFVALSKKQVAPEKPVEPPAQTKAAEQETLEKSGEPVAQTKAAEQVEVEEKKGPPALPITPAPRPRPSHVVTTRQEEAVRHLESKRKRPRRGTDFTPVVKAKPGQKAQPEAAEQAEVSKTNQETAPTLSLSNAAAATAAQTPEQAVPNTPQPPQQVVPNTPPIAVVASAGSLTREEQELLRWRRHRKLMMRHISRKHMREGRTGKQRTTNRVWMSLAGTFLTFLVLLLSLTGAGSYVAYRFYSDTESQFTSQVINLRDLMPKDNLKIYDSKGVFIDQLVDDGVHTTVTLKQIAQPVIDATVSTEDKDFWTNPGIDVARILQAALDDVRYGHVVEGGSTITQQLIKQLVVGNQTSLQRKMQEVMLTPLINEHYSKSDIMEMYLNTVYYGEQAYGIDAAANIYFGIPDQPGKPAALQLDLAQAAVLAGTINSPSGRDPLVHPQAALERMDFVLDRMVANGYITKVQALDASREARSPHFFKGPINTANRAPHFVNFVLGQLEQAFHLTRQQLSRSDMSVYTTLDIALQDRIQKIAQQHIAELSAHNVTNAAEVLMDFHTGAILSLLGSIDYNNKSIGGQFDVATQGYRQPGSSFKPYVYVTAFEQGASPAQAVNDAALTINLPGGDPPTFTPVNYDHNYHGHMTLRCALQNSLNIPAVKVLQHVGIDAAMKTAEAMGISSYNGTPGYSLVLGGLGVHLLDHTEGYATFANGGVRVPYYAIQKVVFATTHQTYEHPYDPGKRVISPQLAYMMTSVLSDNQTRLPEFYDCNPLQLYSNSQYDCYAGNRGSVRPAAAKTGTTNDFKDNWTMGYTTDYVMGVWAGNNDGTPMVDVTGVQGAAPIWHDSMLAAEQNRPIRDFVNPGGLEQATVTYPDGVHTTDWFLPGTVPTAPIPTATPAPGNNDGNGNMQPQFSQDPPGKNKGKGSVAGGHPYCPNNFSFTGGGGAGSVW